MYSDFSFISLTHSLAYSLTHSRPLSLSPLPPSLPPSRYHSLYRSYPEDPEAETRKLLQDASKATKLAVVKDGIASLLEAIDSEGAKGPPLGPNVVSAAFTSDAAAAAAFGREFVLQADEEHTLRKVLPLFVPFFLLHIFFSHLRAVVLFFWYFSVSRLRSCLSIFFE
jgi:hypothetical protein